MKSLSIEVVFLMHRSYGVSYQESFNVAVDNIPEINDELGSMTLVTISEVLPSYVIGGIVASLKE